MATDTPAAFPCALTLDVPFPDARLAAVALQALRVDKELSSLVKRDLSAVAPEGSPDATVLRIEYKAATNRMLRVAVNSFLESLALVVEVQEELDVDVVEARQAQGGSG
ncbi:transcription factor Pcc1-domain-containing protein [Parachaetomium inaequale]|uniref:Transcription factor Pcc1-domain-containing protein n=1 Tax=Parachaetomium inaequale TaxID=2588326 RepID=A0AAN6SU77_9PEZI|nr:transcription factor Pcc1-domain-containing protein [Parachaetomium inaequale]